MTYLVKMMKKNKNTSSKGIKVAKVESTFKKTVAIKNDKDFGGIPDIDPKKFLGCG